MMSLEVLQLRFLTPVDGQSSESSSEEEILSRRVVRKVIVDITRRGYYSHRNYADAEEKDYRVSLRTKNGIPYDFALHWRRDKNLGTESLTFETEDMDGTDTGRFDLFFESTFAGESIQRDSGFGELTGDDIRELPEDKRTQALKELLEAEVDVERTRMFFKMFDLTSVNYKWVRDDAKSLPSQKGIHN